MRVLLLGGGSGTGKTSLARELSGHLSIPLSQTDDFRLFAQRITSATERPDLHFFVDEATAEPRRRMAAEVQRDHLIAVAEVVSNALEIVIAHHLAVDQPLVVEGDAITPALAAQATFNGVPAEGRVKAIFLHEPHEPVVLQNMLSRGRGMTQLPASEQTKGARLAWLYGEWISTQATQLGLPVVASRPLETLFGRVLDTLRVLEP